MNVGDVVFVKSGGPKMFVSSIKGKNVSTVWLDDDSNISRCDFRITSLSHLTSWKYLDDPRVIYLS